MPIPNLKKILLQIKVLQKLSTETLVTVEAESIKDWKYIERCSKGWGLSSDGGHSPCFV